MHANTNYSQDLLTEASWTASRSLSTLLSNSASPDASRLALYRAINSRSSSIPCSSTLNSRWNLQFAFPSSKHWNALLTQRRIRTLRNPTRSSGQNSRECPLGSRWLRTDARADARCSNAVTGGKLILPTLIFTRK